MRASIVLVENGSRGTGIIWPDPGRVVTAYHVATDGPKLRVRIPNGTSAWQSATIERVLPSADLALLKLENDSGLSPLRVTDRDPDEGTTCATWGFQLGKPVAPRAQVRVALPAAFVKHVVSHRAREEMQRAGFPNLLSEVILLEGHVFPGYSGAPVFGPKGSVVAVISGGEPHENGISWALPANPYLRMLRNSDESAGVRTRFLSLNVFWESPVGRANQRLSLDSDEVARWRRQLMRRYDQFLGRGVDRDEIERLILILRTCDVKKVNELLVSPARYALVAE